MSFRQERKRSLSPLSFIISSFLVICSAGAAFSQTDETGQSPANVEIPKVEVEGVWQPADGGEQVALWPGNVALAKPDTGDHPEATGNGSPLVGGKKWHWEIGRAHV